jgi:serine/threonine protein kinase
MKVALDLLTGLSTMHKKGIVHRDLGDGNYLINIPHGKPSKRNIVACIADFGRADYAKNVAHNLVQARTTYTPPEGLYLKKMNSNDYFKSDVFALGIAFYRLFYGKLAPWQDTHYVTDTHHSLHHRYKELKARVKKGTKARRTYLANKTCSPKQEFEYLILRMLHTNPEKRGTATQLQKKMKKIFARAV